MPTFAAAVEAFRQMQVSVEQLRRVPSVASTEAARRITGLIHMEFEEGHDPYGRPWQQLAASTVRKKGHDRILVDTHLAEDTTRAVPMSGAGIQVETNQPALAFHQVGGSRLPRRPVYPDNRGLPDSWNAAIAESLDTHFARVMGRSG